jgi:serine/threonine protein kinase
VRLAANTTIGESRYRLERRLGAGGMASVWLAHDERLGRRVAVKVISDSLASDPAFVARFEREARAAAVLSHRNVVKLFDYGVDDHRPYLVLEYVEGPSLADWLAREPRPPLDSDALARRLLDALAHIHAAGIVHRDIKPGNVLLDADGTPKVTDFGIAKTDETTALTRTGQVIGTLKYLAPEVTEGAPATVATDLYSLGVLLREVTGPAPPTLVGTLIETLTAREPERRPSSARAALAQLEGKEPTAVLSRKSESKAPTELLPPGTRVLTIRRGRLFALAGAVAIAVVVALTLVIGRAEPQPEPVRPAPANAPLDQQLRTLERGVDSAAGRE